MRPAGISRIQLLNACYLANSHGIVKTTCRAGCSESEAILHEIKKFCWNVKAYKFVLPKFLKISHYEQS